MSARDFPFSQVRRNQPDGFPPLDPAFKRGLTLAYLGTEQRPVDRVSGRLGVLRGVASNYSTGVGSLGRTVNTYTGSGQGVQFAVKSETVASCTLIIGISVTDVWNVFVGFEADNNTYIGGNGSGQFNIRQGGTDLTGGSVAANTFNIIAVSFNGTAVRAYKNGIFQLSGTGGSTAFSSTWNFGGNAGGGGTSNPKIAFAYVWDRPLPDSDLRELSLNPYRLFAPIQRRLFVEAPAGGATNLVIAEALHAHAADNLALTQLHLLTVADAAHAHAADNLTLTQLHLLTVADASHAHLADNLTLTQQHTLAIAEALHAHAAENVVLSVLGTLAVNDALHAHAADNLTLTQAHQLTVADAAHAHTADNLALTQAHILAIQEALHAHTADNLTLAIGGTTLAIAEALHAHAADNLALTQLHVLVINDTLHAHLADMLTLELPGAAILHDRILFIRGETRTLVIVADNRTLTVH